MATKPTRAVVLVKYPEVYAETREKATELLQGEHPDRHVLPDDVWGCTGGAE